jgi:alpha-1,3-rhamnosyl/mannosyltransferase
MKIALDARMIRHSGIGTYTRGILKPLMKVPDFEWILFGNPEKLSGFQAKTVEADFPIYSVREQMLYPGLLRREKPDVFHVPHYNAPILWGGPMVVNIHDLIHLRFPPSRAAYLYARGLLHAVCRRARIILAISEHTRRDLIEVLGADERKIRMTVPGVDSEFFEPAPPSPVEGPYVLYVGNVRPVKNVEVLLKAFREARRRSPDMALVVAGRDFMPQVTREYRNDPGVRFMEEIPFDQLRGLYAGARMFVFPSLYEGFGLPPLEAMACGTPVICSNASSLPEVTGDAAVSFDPRNAGELTDAMVRLWKDDAERRKLSEKGRLRAKAFTWERCAQQLASAYREAVSGGPR